MIGIRSFKAIRATKAMALVVAIIVLAFSSHAAYAFGTVGDMIENTVASSSRLPFLFSGTAYLAGIGLAIMGIIKLKEHVLNPAQVTLSEPLKRFLAGGCCFALPMVLEVAQRTLIPVLDPLSNVTGFNVTASGTPGLDTMFIDLLTDIWTPMMDLFSGFTYLGGIVLILIGISRLLKSAQEGPRGPAGLGTIFTFLVGGAMLSIDSMMSAFGWSFGGDGDLHTFGVVDFATSMDLAEQDHINSVVAAILAFMMIIGWVSFIRGFFIIRQVAEGNHQASLMAGMTHVFGGALAVNLGPVMQTVQDTFGLTGLGITFT